MFLYIYLYIHTHFVCREVSSIWRHFWAQWHTKRTRAPLQAPVATVQGLCALLILQNELINWFTGVSIASQKPVVPYRAWELGLERGFNALQYCRFSLAPFPGIWPSEQEKCHLLSARAYFQPVEGHSLTHTLCTWQFFLAQDIHLCHFQKAWKICHHVSMGQHSTFGISWKETEREYKR